MFNMHVISAGYRQLKWTYSEFTKWMCNIDSSILSTGP